MCARPRKALRLTNVILYFRKLITPTDDVPTAFKMGVVAQLQPEIENPASRNTALPCHRLR